MRRIFYFAGFTYAHQNGKIGLLSAEKKLSRRIFYKMMCSTKKTLQLDFRYNIILTLRSKEGCGGRVKREVAGENASG
jgi:hypothetical protein